MGHALLFSDMHCRGRVGRFAADPDPMRIAKYSQAELWQGGIGDNWVSSVMLPYGYSVRLYDYDGWTGSSKVVSGGMFTDNTFAMPCIDVYSDFNDKTNSIQVFRNTSLGNATGYWVAMTGSSDLNYELHEGFTSSHSESTTEINQFTLSMEMSYGMSFVVESASIDISESYSYTI